MPLQTSHVIAALALGVVGDGPPAGWSHGWDTPADAWWGYGAMGGAVFTDDQVAFAAKTYKIVILSYCPGGSNYTTVGAIEQVL